MVDLGPPLLMKEIRMFMVAADTETTGLSSKKNQLLEVGFVLIDTKDILAKSAEWLINHRSYLVDYVRSLPSLGLRILHDPSKLVYNDFVRKMNHDFIQSLIDNYEEYSKLSNEELLELGYCRPEEVQRTLFKFLFSNHVVSYDEMVNGKIKNALTALGKNFSGFDKPFLESVIDFSKIKFRHRVADPSPLYFNIMLDEALPDLKTCMNRSGLFSADYEVAHTSVADAQDTAIVFLSKVIEEHLTTLNETEGELVKGQ